MPAVTSCANLQYLFAKKEGKTREKSFSLNREVKPVNPVIVEFLILACFSYGIFLTSTAINKCSPNPCKNMGACSEFEDDYVCNCPQGFKGKTCEGTFIYETHHRYIGQNRSCDDRCWWGNDHSFSSSVRTLVWRWRQRNLPLNHVRHVWVLVCFLNLSFLISVVNFLAVVGRTRQYRFPTNNYLRATISLKSRR